MRIGSAPDCEVQICGDPFVSRYHCAIEAILDGQVILEDTGSLNGTWVDQTRAYRTALRPGNRIRVGRTNLHIVSAVPSSQPILGRSPAILELRRQIEKLGPIDASVVIHGETGTGKEIVAEALHRASGRRGLFLPINCATINPALVVSTLFGHEVGAFTGATAPHRGVFVEADGGTLFLDEVAELDPVVQASLLRVLETGIVRPIGARAEARVDVRVVAATHVDLMEAVAAGRFRRDLFYRLAHHIIEVPPLRERREDIPMLAQHLLRQQDPIASLTAAALERLAGHDWRGGNVRELRQCLERALVMSSSSTIGPQDITFVRVVAPPAARDPEDVYIDDGKVTLQEFETRLYRRRLEHHRGNATAAAKSLGIPRQSFVDWCRKYGLLS
jgi:two-component system response regulator HydG